MSNQMPIYSHVVPKSQQCRAARAHPNGKGASRGESNPRPQNLGRGDFDPLNHNHGGNFHLMNLSESRGAVEKQSADRRESRKSKEDKARRAQNMRTEVSEGKVEAYLRQNQVSIRQQQHRHSAVRQAEHRVNLRSLPLNDGATPARGHDRTPTDRHRGLTEREKERDGNAREHRRERDRDRDQYDFEGLAQNMLSPVASHGHRDRESGHRPPRKSGGGARSSEPPIAADKRRFFCREWAFQKVAHCLEQRPVSKTCGALILGNAGSGKTAICQELSEPGQGPQARQQRALNRRLLARHFLQGNRESSLRPGDFVRSLAMQILSHSSQHRQQRCTPGKEVQSPYSRKESDEPTSPENGRHNTSDEDRMERRFHHLADDGEDSSKPLLADSEDQRTDEEEGGPARRARTIDRIHERRDYLDSLVNNNDAQVPEVLPRAPPAPPTNPFLGDPAAVAAAADTDHRLYENHDNLFLRNSRELRRQSSEPRAPRHDSGSGSPPGARVSRIPVASFRYPNKSDLRSSSNENSPHKSKPPPHDANASDKEKETVKREETDVKSPSGDNESDPKIEKEETPDYQNVLKPNTQPPPTERDTRQNEDVQTPELPKLVETNRSVTQDCDEVPPPIPTLPVSPRTLIADAYYEKLLADPEIQQALLPHNLDKSPDECFKKALLFPLLEIDPPKQCLFLLVDSIDEGALTLGSKDKEEGRSAMVSRTVAELLANHHHLFPQWLLLVCTARKQSKSLTKMFTGFRKITLDELHRAHVSADVQRYVLARLDTEPRLRSRVSCDSTAAAAAAAALDHLRIKSDGCMLYLEKVLDGVADGFIALREIKEIPGTLNGLYLWLAQRLFHGRRFTKVRMLLDVLLAARCGVTEEMLYKCLLTKEYSVSREDFNRRLHLLRRILVMEPRTAHLSIFHHSLASWLVDVKHCTRRYLCSPQDGHAALAMYYTLEAKRLSALEIHNFILHMTNVEQHLMSQKKTKQSESIAELEPIDLHTVMLLWVLDSGCDIESALKKETEQARQLENKFGDNVEHTECNLEESDNKPIMDGKPTEGASSPLDTLLPEFVEGARWPRDARVLRALLELARGQPLEHPVQTLTEKLAEIDLDKDNDDAIELMSIDPNMVHELASRGDEDSLQLLLKRHPELSRATDAGGATALHGAARAGRAACAALLLRAGASIDAADADGWTPLRAAAWAGHTEVVEALLEFGCDVDCVDSDNRTALRAAAWSGHEAAVRRLLAAGAKADLADAEGRTPLIAAAYMGHADIVRALLDAGASLNHADEDGRTALSVASLCAGGAACAALLLERGADASKADRDRATPLLVAAFEGHTEICELLLEHEADAEAADAGGRTALWAAASAGHAATVRLLLFWGACVDSMDAEGRTVLSTAAAQGNVEVVRQLLDRGLDEHHRDNSGWTPLHYAAFEGHVEVCEALLEAGAKVDEADNDGKGPLLLCAQEGHARLIEALVDDWGAPVDQHAHDGKTALRLAALEGHFDCVRALHSRGADPDALDADRRSTLYVLALDNRLAMARYLLRECGASVHTRDAEGRTPLHVSAWQGHTEMVNLLIKVGGAAVDGRDRCARTALHAAAWRGRTSALQALLAHGASPAAVCTQGATPLGIAAQEGHEECVLWLLQHGADPLQADHCGRTPGKVAWRAGHANICRLLERWGAPSAPPAHEDLVSNSPDYKRRSVHSSNSTKSSSNLTGGSGRSHEAAADPVADVAKTNDKTNRANLSLSFAQQVARCGRGARRERERDSAIPEHCAVEQDSKLRSYVSHERDGELRGYGRERDRRREERHARDLSPLYASPPRSPPTSPLSDLCSPTAPAIGSQPPSLTSAQPVTTDQHFNRDTHMRIILGRDFKPPVDRNDSKNKRNGIVTNPAMRLVANVRNGLDSAAANIRRTGVALAASASSSNPAVKTNAFQWRKETPL